VNERSLILLSFREPEVMAEKRRHDYDL
jgi:hypothetical protein